MSEIIDEDQAFADLIATIIDRRRKQGLALIPDWIAAEATHELDPNRISHPVIYEACRLHLRHIASRYPWHRAQEHGRAEGARRN